MFTRIKCKALSFVILFSMLLGIIVLYNPMTVKAATYYYVDGTNGNDNNNGTSTGTAFRTIQKAASVALAGDTVYIRGGIYRETVTPSYSGSSGAPIRFTNYNGEYVVVSACDKVNGWSVYSGNIFRASLSWDLGITKNDVFVDGQVIPEARTPNTPESPYQYPVSGLEGDPFYFPPLGSYHVVGNTVNDSKLNGFANNAFVGGYYTGTHYDGWFVQQGPITASTSGQVTVNTSESWVWFDETRAPYWAENGRGSVAGVMACLDAPGEWVITGGEIRLWCPDSGNPASKTVEVKRRKLVFDLTNRNYIELVGLNFKGGSVKMHDSTYCVIDSCYGTNMSKGSSGFSGFKSDYPNSYLDNGGIWISGHHNTVKNCTLENNSPVNLSGTDNTVTNNMLRTAGTVLTITFDPTKPVGTGTGRHTINWNTIYNSSYAVVTWDPGPNYETFYHCTFTNNEVYNGDLRCGDCGVWYDYDTDAGKDGIRTLVYNNVFHDDWGLYNHNSCVLYFDNFSKHFEIGNNIVYCSPGSAQYGFVVNTGSVDCPYYGINQLYNHTGGNATLTDADFPGGRFGFGCNLSNPPPTPTPAPTPTPGGSTKLTVSSASASSTFPGWTASLAIDGLITPPDSTTWSASSAAQPQWLKLDLGSIKTVNKTNIAWYNPTVSIYTYNIQVSTDDVTYTTVVPSKQSTSSTWLEDTFANTSARYVKINITASTYDYDCITEAEVYGTSGATPTPAPTPTPTPTPGGSTKLTVSSASASSTFPAWVASLAIDGLITPPDSTSWSASSAAQPQWLKLDLGSIKTVNKTNIAWYNPTVSIYTYNIQVSTDDVTYTTVVPSKQSTSSTWLEDTFANTSARYVKINITASTYDYDCITEAEVYGN